MIYTRLPDEESAQPRHLPFYLAMEEWLAARRGDRFVMWQVNPTVIFGRNQVIEAEVNLGFCRERGIEFYRRKSGGGCVYADRQNIMVARICDSDNVEESFATFCDMVAAALRALGIDAHRSGRNDITVGGRKISGNAFMLLPGNRAIIHGTLLYDVDPEAMEGALTPSAEKLAAKGVSSVRSHVTTVSEHRADLSIDALKQHLVQYLTDGTETLTPADVTEIERVAEPYFAPSWIFDGRKPGRTRRRRIEGAGEFAVSVTLDGDGLIAAVDLTGDFMPLGDVDALLDRLKGVRPEAEALSRALDGTSVPNVISGLSDNDFINLIIP